jgi:flagellar L-ring protein FlgH
MKHLTLILLALVLFSDVGCAGFGRKIKNFLGGDPNPPPAAATNDGPKYSENSDLSPHAHRQYKRTTKESLANDAGLDAKSGSLWVMEGQGAYLFAQNVMRLVGDPIGVQIEGEAKEQLQAKVDVLKELISKLEEKQKMKMRQLASEGSDDKPEEKKPKEKEKTDDKKTAGADKDSKDGFAVKTVPTRITERTVEGNYRVKGSQPFMIGQREFKVIVTGVVRAEDFNDDGIPASKLLEPKFDVVSAKRAEM